MNLSLKLAALLSFVVLLSGATVAQNGDYFDRGSVTYSIEAEGMGDAETFLSQTSIELLFDGNKAKMDFVMMAGFVRLQLIQDKKQTMLMDIPIFDESPAVEIDKDWMQLLEEESRRNQSPIKAQDFKISYDHADRKRIAGYRCHRANIKAKDGSVISLYVCPKLRPKNFGMMGSMFKDIEGLPMSIEIKSEGKSLRIQADEVSQQRPDASLFDIPDSYSIMTMEEFRKMLENNFSEGGVGL